MSKLIINGGKKLSGKIEIRGMKNAATPILAATLLTKEDCIIDNLPRIKDVEKMIDILVGLGSRLEWIGKHCLKISNQEISYQNIDHQLIKSMRSSILLIGPLLARLGQVNLPEPGGCIIGKRPIDTHLSALEQLGVEITKEKGSYHFQGKLKGSTIILPEFSVTATENLVMTAVLAQGTTIIKLAATEPHVQDLCSFLNQMGAKIKGVGTHTLEIEGVKELKGIKYSIIPDQIEIGTFAVMAAATRSHITIENIIPEQLDIILLKLKQIGVNFKVGNNFLEILPSELKSFRLQTMPYPGFPTDLQAPFAILATQAIGTSLIHDPMFEGRMGYVSELVKMGANAIVADPHRVIISGPTPLYGIGIKSFDLRAGATLIIAGLVAQGQTIVSQAEIIDRGYEKIEERLKQLGADIIREED